MGYLLIFLLGFTLYAAAGGLGAFLSELFPPDVRGAGVGFAYNVGRGVGALGPMVIGLLAADLTLGGAIAGVGLTMLAIALVMVWLLPETLGKDLLRTRDLTLFHSPRCASSQVAALLGGA